MAELFLAKQVGLDGFEKVVAIKRILAHLAHDQDFVQMIQDEARIVAKLSHPNIVQIYDLGKADDTYFIAMEYIPGRNLSSVSKKAKALRKALPPTYIAHCVSQACEGLYYAHTRYDTNGRPLNIVHRDVSPQNIIVSFSGSVKLVDFGIAKAATKIAHTRAGVLKGKYAYMSPEQIRGEPTDARSDLFAVGIVLYELLCGRRPFEKENSIQTLKAIVQDDPPPCQSFNPAISNRLASIIERCMAKRPQERFQTAQEIQLALEEFVAQAPARVNSLAISQWISALFEDEMSAGQGGVVNLPGVGAVVLPERSAKTEEPVLPASTEGPDTTPSPSARAEVNGREEVIDGRSDLIREGIIERRDSTSAEPSVAASGASAAPGRAALPRTPSVADLPGPRTTRNPPLEFDESEGFMAPLGGDSIFDSHQDDPWDEATVGLPDHLAPENDTHAVGDERSEPSKDAPVDESVPPAEEAPGWVPFESDDGFDDVWAEKTSADDGLFSSDLDGVLVREFDDEEGVPFEEDLPFAEATMAQAVVSDDRTVDQARFERAPSDATVDQAAIDPVFDGPEDDALLGGPHDDALVGWTARRRAFGWTARRRAFGWAAQRRAVRKTARRGACWEDRTTTRCPEDRTTTRCPEDRTTTRCPEDRTTTRCPEDRTTPRCPEDRTTPRCPEDRTTTRCPEDRTTTRCPEDRTTPRCPEDRTIMRFWVDGTTTRFWVDRARRRAFGWITRRDAFGWTAQRRAFGWTARRRAVRKTAR